MNKGPYSQITRLVNQTQMCLYPLNIQWFMFVTIHEHILYTFDLLVYSFNVFLFLNRYMICKLYIFGVTLSCLMHAYIVQTSNQVKYI